MNFISNTVSTIKGRMFSSLNYLEVFVLMALFICVPSIDMPELIHSTQTGKFIFFSYVMLLVIAFWVAKGVLSPSQTWQINSLDLSLLVLFIYVLVNRYWVHPYGYSMKFYELVGLSILYFVLRGLSKRFFYYLLLAVVIGGIIQAIYGALQLWGYYASHHSGFKMTGSFFNPGPYAGFLIAVFPIALGLYLFRDKIEEITLNFKSINFPFIETKLKTAICNKLLNKIILEYLPLVGILSIMLVLPASQSRAAWLGTLISALFLLLIRYKTFKHAIVYLNTVWKKILICVLLVMCCSAVIMGLYHFKKGSADGRLLIWKVTSDMIVDHPLFGVGYDRFKSHYMNYQADYFREYGQNGEEMVAGEAGYAFNEFLLFLAEQGLMGLLILLTVVVFFMRAVFKSRESFRVLIVTSGMLGILVFSFFSYASEILPIKICIVLFAVIMANESLTKGLSVNLTNGPKYAMGVLVSLAIVFLYIRIEELEKGYLDWQEAMTTYRYGLYEDSIEEYEKTNPALFTNGEFLMNYGKALSMSGQHSKAVKVLIEADYYLSSTVIQTTLADSQKMLKNYTESERSYRVAWYMIPSRFYPKYLLAKMYVESGQQTKAIEIAHELLDKEVKIESTAIKEIRAEIKEIIDADKSYRDD